MWYLFHGDRMHKSWKGWGRAEPHCIPPLKVHPHWAALTNMANSGLCLRPVLPDKVKAASSVGGTEPAVPCRPLPSPLILHKAFCGVTVQVTGRNETNKYFIFASLENRHMDQGGCFCFCRWLLQIKASYWLLQIEASYWLIIAFLNELWALAGNKLINP